MEPNIVDEFIELFARTIVIDNIFNDGEKGALNKLLGVINNNINNKFISEFNRDYVDTIEYLKQKENIPLLNSLLELSFTIFSRIDSSKLRDELTKIWDKTYFTKDRNNSENMMKSDYIKAENNTQILLYAYRLFYREITVMVLENTNPTNTK